MSKDGIIRVKCKYVINDTSIHNGNYGSGCTLHDNDFDCWGLNISCHSIREINWTTFIINRKHLIEVK